MKNNNNDKVLFHLRILVKLEIYNFSIINNALLNHAINHGFYDPSKPFIENYCTL